MVELPGGLGTIGAGFSGITNVLFYMVIVLGAIAILGGILFWVYRKKSFKYRVIVLEEGGDGATLVNYDKGRIARRGDKTEVFKLQKYKKAVLPSPPLSSINISATGKRTVFLKKFGNNIFDYMPIAIYLRNLDTIIEPFPEGRNNFIQTEFKRSSNKYGNFFEKYQSMIIMGGVTLIMVVVLIITFKMNGDTADKFVEASKLLSDAINNFNTPAVVESSSPPPVG